MIGIRHKDSFQLHFLHYFHDFLEILFYLSCWAFPKKLPSMLFNEIVQEEEDKCSNSKSHVSDTKYWEVKDEKMLVVSTERTKPILT